MRFLHLSTLLFSSLLMHLTLIGAKCLPHQTLALMQFKLQALADPSHLASWNSTVDCCQWPGISCNLAGTHVTALELTGLSITAGAPSLSQLAKLKSLTLHSNHFISSSTLTNLHQLPRLTHLNLSGSSYSHEVAPAISRIRSLISLDLSSEPSASRSLNLKALVSNLSNLQELYLDGIDLSSPGNEWSEILASSLPKLRLLSLANCSISGRLRPSLLNLTHLTSLSLHSNNLASPPAFLSNFSSLQVLNLSSCNLVGDFPPSVLRIRTLRRLDMSSNPSLAGQVPDLIGKANLKILQLSNSNLHGSLPLSLSNLTSLVFLDLSSNNFTGQVPPLTNLAQLVYLDLSNNSFSGPIPHIGDKLVRLATLNLQDNVFNESIPASLFTLPSLRTLQLQQNKLNGEINDFSGKPNSSSLTILDLRSNYLHGSVPKFLFELPKLIILELSSNNFTGAIELSWLEKLNDLNTLGLSNNRLSVQILVSNFPRLRTLKLSSCNLTQVPEFLRNQTMLLELDLSNNFIHGDIPKWIWELHLTHLNLSNNLLTGLEQPHNNIAIKMLDLHSNFLQGPFPLPSSSHFSGAILDYSSNKFNSIIPSDIGAYLSVTIYFSLANNSLHGKIPESICDALNLRALYLSHNSLSGTIPKCLVQMNHLLVLNLAENSLTGVIPNSFTAECKLRMLELNGNYLQGKVPLSLQECDNLEVLNIGSNRINDEFPNWLQKTPYLLVLILGANQFYGPIVIPPNALQDIQIIDLSRNNFSGKILSECFHGWIAMKTGNHTENPANNDKEDSNVHEFGIKVIIFGSLDYQVTVTITSKGLVLKYLVTTILTSIDFSSNNLDGAIPDSIGSLAQLYLLNLSHNALTGSIPGSFGNLRQLESLDLSNNNLTGTIPNALGQIPRLPFLNLSFNRLEGRIPQTTQFGSFPISSFEGNEGLCGLPLSKECEEPGITKEGSWPGDDDHDHWNWIAVEVGYVTGLGIVVFPLMLWRRWRRWYMMRVEIMLWRISLFLHMERWIYKDFYSGDDGELE